MWFDAIMGGQQSSGNGNQSNNKMRHSLKKMGDGKKEKREKERERERE